MATNEGRRESKNLLESSGNAWFLPSLPSRLEIPRRPRQRSGSPGMTASYKCVFPVLLSDRAQRLRHLRGRPRCGVCEVRPFRCARPLGGVSLGIPAWNIARSVPSIDEGGRLVERPAPPPGSERLGPRRNRRRRLPPRPLCPGRPPGGFGRSLFALPYHQPTSTHVHHSRTTDPRRFKLRRLHADGVPACAHGGPRRAVGAG